MPDLEGLIYTRLASDATIAAQLPTVDGGDPAIFAEQAPGPTSARWDTPSDQAPRVVLAVERIQDPVRGSDATLSIGLYGPADALPALVRAVAARLDGVYWHPDAESPLATRIRQVLPDPTLAEYAGVEDAVTLEFDVLAFPANPAFDPDPVARLYAWAAEVEGAGYDTPAVQTEPGSWDADAEAPALYVSLRNESLVKRWPLKMQWTAEARLHILHADAMVRNDAARRLLHALALSPSLRLGRGWLVVDRPIAVDYTADPLRLGQLSAQVEFWTDKPPSTTARIEQVVFLRHDVGEEGQFVPPELPIGGS